MRRCFGLWFAFEPWREPLPVCGASSNIWLQMLLWLWLFLFSFSSPLYVFCHRASGFCFSPTLPAPVPFLLPARYKKGVKGKSAKKNFTILPNKKNVCSKLVFLHLHQIFFSPLDSLFISCYSHKGTGAYRDVLRSATKAAKPLFRKKLSPFGAELPAEGKHSHCGFCGLRRALTRALMTVTDNTDAQTANG